MLFDQAPLPVFRVAADGSGQYTTIATALTAAPVTGAIISIKDGTYTLTDAIAANKAKVQFVGDSRAGVIVVSAATKSAFTITADGVKLKSLTIDGGRATGGTGNGIAITAAQRTHIDDCLVQNTTTQGILVSGNPRSSYGILENSTISNLATDGVSRVAGTFYAGFMILSGGDYWTIRNNTFTGWSQAIGLWYGCNYCIVTGNTLIANYGYASNDTSTPRSALEVYPETTVGGHHTISNNIIDGSTLHCIESAQGDNGTLYSYNTLSNYSAFSNLGTPAVFADGGVSQQNIDVVFDHNTIHGAARGGQVLLAGRNLTYTNNAHDNFLSTLQGILIFYGTAATVTATDNTFDVCPGVAYFHTGTDHILSRNTLTNANGTTPVFAYAELINGGEISYNIWNSPSKGKGITLAAGTGTVNIHHNNFSVKYHSCHIYIPSCTIENNTFVSDTTSGGEWTLAFLGAGAHDNSATYNNLTSTNAYVNVRLETDSANNVVQHNTLVGGAIQDVGTGNTITPNP